MRAAAVREPRPAAMTRPQPTVATGIRVLVAVATAVTGFGVFGFTEHGLQPAPQAVISLTSELSALALLLCLEVMLHRSRGAREAISEQDGTLSERGV
jgi:hypothetical protein